MTSLNSAERDQAALDDALDAAAASLAGFVCHHVPPCVCTRVLVADAVALEEK